MFFIFGISNGEKKLDFVQTMLCPSCGQFGRLEVFMTYMYFSLFFIPILRWNKKYYVRSSCCGKVYTLEPEAGRRLKRGDKTELNEEDLKACEQPDGGQYFGSREKRCLNCGYIAASDFDYCPKCGRHL